MKDNNYAFDGFDAAPQAETGGADPTEYYHTLEQDTTPPKEDYNTVEDGADFDNEYENEYDNDQDGDGEDDSLENEAKKADGTASGEPVVTIKFNHKKESITADEAAVRIQKYMKMDPAITKLKYMAAATGESVDELVENMFQTNERAMINKLVDKFGNNAELIGEALQVQRMKHDAAYREMLEAEEHASASEQDNLHGRLAGDFLELKQEFPEFSDFSKVPEDVVRSAVKKDISLLDAYLRFQHSENKKSEDAIASRKAAASSSTGSVRSAETNADSPEISAMIRGIWG